MGAVRQSVAKLRAIRPGQIRREAQRRFLLVVAAADAVEREAVIQVLMAGASDHAAAGRALRALAFPGDRAEDVAGVVVVRVCTPRAAALPGGAPGGSAEGVPEGAVVLDPGVPAPGLLALLRAHPRLRLAMARTFPPLRELLARELIRAAAARNAAVAALSALPEVIPTPLSLVLALGEFGSDTVVITGNQIGLAFELAAVRGEVVGWRAQARPVLSIMLGSLGWRTLARELVGLIPAGVGLAAKAGIAYSGTMAVGTALWRYPHPRSYGRSLGVEDDSTSARSMAASAANKKWLRQGEPLASGRQSA